MLVPAGHATEVERVTLLPERHDVAADLPVDDGGLVEHRGQAGEETGEPRLALVARRHVGQHGERRVVDHIFGRLVAACALAHGLGVRGEPVLARAVAQGARREVDAARLHADEGEGDVVARVVILERAPFHLFHAEDTLEVEDVGVGAVETRWRVDAVQVEHEVVACATVGQPLHHLQCRLVVAVHEVDLESLDPHLGVVAARLLEVLVHDVEHSPQDDAHMPLVGMADEALQVHVGDGVHDVALVGVVPALVEDDILQSVLSGEVYIV